MTTTFVPIDLAASRRDLSKEEPKHLPFYSRSKEGEGSIGEILKFAGVAELNAEAVESLVWMQS